MLSQQTETETAKHIFVKIQTTSRSQLTLTNPELLIPSEKAMLPYLLLHSASNAGIGTLKRNQRTSRCGGCKYISCVDGEFFA